MYDKKFKFHELFLNSSTNKTSGSGFIGILMGLVGCLGFIAAIIGYFLQLPNTIDFMQQTIFFIGGATVLLGARKWVGSNVFNKQINKENINVLNERDKEK